MSDDLIRRWEGILNLSPSVERHQPVERHQQSERLTGELSRYDPAARQEVLRILAQSTGGLRSVLARCRDNRVLQNYLFDHLAEDEVAQEIGRLSLREATNLLEGADLRRLYPILRLLPNERAYLFRHSYQQGISGLPKLVRTHNRHQQVPNYFAILGITRMATPSAISKSWRRLSWAYHPDRLTDQGMDDQDFGRTMTCEFNEAYGILKNPARRQHYLESIPSRSDCFPTEAWFRELDRLELKTRRFRQSGESSR